MKPFVLGLCLVLTGCLLPAQPGEAAFTRTEDVIYGRKLAWP